MSTVRKCPEYHESTLTEILHPDKLTQTQSAQKLFASCKHDPLPSGRSSKLLNDFILEEKAKDRTW